MATAQQAQRLVVRRQALDTTQVRSATLEIGDGDVLLEVDRFALTANNVTYAVTGDMLGYWRFFPVDGDWGVVPAWGLATVVASTHDDVAVGEELYGYVPMSTHLVLRPARVTAADVVDGSPHRDGLAGAYQSYARLAADPLHDPAQLDLELLHRPLFTTAFLLAEDVVGGQESSSGSGDDPLDEVVVITSASSKTGTALASLLRGRGVVVIGLTSTTNLDHVRSLGLHDQVFAYDHLEGLGDVPGRAVAVDLAGRADVMAAVHRALPAGLTRHLAVGLTHHDAAGDATAAQDAPRSAMFFAPRSARALVGRWGREVFDARVAAAWEPFVEMVAGSIEIVVVDGLDAAADSWRRLVGGDVDPRRGIVVRPDVVDG